MTTTTSALSSAILAELGITEPPFLLKVETDVGGAAIELRDAQSSPGHPSGGAFVSNAQLEGPPLTDANIPNSARDAADQMRADLEKHLGG